jgi:DnaK suppressor protein
MSHLTPDEIAEIRSQLERQLARLERSMRVTDTAAEPVTLDQSAVGRLSRIDSLQNQAMARNLQERERIKLAHIQGALRRMDEGTYGVCVECGRELPFGRLLVLPEAPTCAACGDAA